MSEVLEGLTEETLPADYPADEQIDAWKKQYGEVHRLKYSSDRVYIYRGITRPEHKEIRGQLDPSQPIDQDTLDEMIFKYGVLYPKITPEFIASTKSGEIPIVAEQIMQLSGYAPETPPEKL